MNLSLNLDDKRIKKIVYQLEDGKTIEYTLNDGEINHVEIIDSKECGEPNAAVNEDSLLYPTVNQIDGAKKLIEMDKNGEIDEILRSHDFDSKKKKLTDSEMIEAVKKSEFMNEVNAARKRFKIGKEIVDGFPENDDIYRENPKRSEDKCSDESLKVAQEIIKMDREGKLDEFLKRHSISYIDKFIREETESPLNDSELADDSTACLKNMNTIERKILRKIRMGEGDVTKDKEFEKLVENYNFYRDKKKELDDKIWDSMPKVDPETLYSAPINEAKPSIRK